MDKEEFNEVITSEKEEQSAGSDRSIIGRILYFAGVLLMVFVVCTCLCIAVPKFIGYESYIVVSGSMEPDMPVGSIAISRKVDPAQLQTGDVIVFVDPQRGQTPITHRVVSNDPGTGTIVTKGDANEHEDVNPATYDNVKGKIVRHAPYLGYVASLFTSLLGKMLVVLIALEGWLFTEIGRRLSYR
jgi:signal peptidase I